MQRKGNSKAERWSRVETWAYEAVVDVLYVLLLSEKLVFFKKCDMLLS